MFNTTTTTMSATTATMSATTPWYRDILYTSVMDSDT
jgi:hypothetical protein